MMTNPLLCHAPKRVMQQTSLIAYQELSDDNISGRYKMILDLLTRQHPTPMTDREIAFSLAFTDPNMIRPRRNELVKAGILHKVCKKKCDVTGKTSIAWGIK